MNDKFIRSLEDDILIKQKIIESNKNNKYNYQSISNFNYLNLENDSKFEKLIEKMVEKEEEMEKNNNGVLDNEVFVNRIIATFYYSLMINKDRKINDILIKTLEKSLNKINENKGDNIEKNLVNVNNKTINYDIKIISNNIDYIYDKKEGGSNEDELKKNNYINIDNNRNSNNNNNFNISFDCSEKLCNIANNNNQNQNKNLFNKKKIYLKM